MSISSIAWGAACAQTTPPAAPGPAQPPSTVVLTLADALARAKENSPQFQAAVTELGLAREDRYQARAALLPGVDYNNSFIYTQGNGTASGRLSATTAYTNTLAKARRTNRSEQPRYLTISALPP